MAPRDIPNIISIVRILLVGPVVWSLLDGRYELAIILFAIAGISDAVDGFLAKHYGWESRLGGILDPFADKLLLICTFFSLAWLGMISWWLVVLIVFRDLVVMGGGVLYNWLIERFEAEPSLSSKISTTLQIVLGVLALTHLGIYPLPVELFYWLELAVAAAVIVSGVGYVLEWSRRTIRHAANKH
jgi:cardiolipin synthase